MIAFLLALCAPAFAAAPTRIILPPALQEGIARVRWTPELADRLIRGMPKVETHLHLDGALSPATIKALAAQQNYAPLAGKSEREIAKLAVVDKPKDSLTEVLAAFNTIYPLLHTAEAIERMAYEAVRAASRQNIRYFEARFAPALNTAEGFSTEQVLEAALKGLKRGERDFGVKSGVIICLLRPFAWVSREKNAEMLDVAIRYKDRGVVAVDLAGDEAKQPLSDFREFFEKAKAAGLRLTAHAGEAPGSGDLETALELGVDRVGHATLLAQRPDLVQKFARAGIPIEVNLTSNLRTAAVKDLKDHPVKQWYAAGIPVTLSTDDPGIFGVDLNHEYRLLHRELHFPLEDVLAVSYQGIDALFLPQDQKRELKSRFETDLKALLRGLRRR